ncbi:nitroreductase family protein [Paraburkholderia sp. SARCC-3016]|uniref:nitroreductase family protein n=1 Tax=Paraburkholderia sp. SARCC-3016 TaxID=3058611 RepID=UPI0028087B09|nr:nitroreductase family protein [Paraburkholderia sp. SARCC-3016]MDQ7980978.1 nitroreductase family protein [Paraburkholderia sp. SARCC-3016]
MNNDFSFRDHLLSSIGQAPQFDPLSGFQRQTQSEMESRARTFYESIARRRTVRDFSAEPVPDEVIRLALRAAGTAPSGANLQPWHFVVVKSPLLKRRIRLAAEEEERTFYDTRAPQEWLDALKPLGTDARKPFLEIAPVLIAIFSQNHTELEEDTRVKHYYVSHSTGIATGFLITALHEAGLVTLTHTPSPMGFLNEICQRPATEKPFLLLVTGFPADDCQVPRFGGVKKSDEEFSSWL